MLTRPHRRQPDKDYRLCHPWYSVRTRWLWLVGVALYWPALAAALSGWIAATLFRSLAPLLYVSTPALLIFAAGLTIDQRSWRPIPAITRVGMPPWPVVLTGQAVLTAVIIGAVEILARTTPTLNQGPSYALPGDFWSALIAAVVYPMVTAIFGTEAIRQAIEGRWQHATIHAVQVSLFIAAGRLHPELGQVESRTAAIIGGLVCGLARWVSRSRARPMLASVRSNDDGTGWCIRGIRVPRYIAVTAEQLDPPVRQQLAETLDTYHRIPEGWPEVAGREQLVRIVELARRLTKQRRPRPRTRTELDDQLTELDRLAKATEPGGVVGR